MTPVSQKEKGQTNILSFTILLKIETFLQVKYLFGNVHKPS